MSTGFGEIKREVAPEIYSDVTSCYEDGMN